MPEAELSNAPDAELSNATGPNLSGKFWTRRESRPTCAMQDTELEVDSRASCGKLQPRSGRFRYDADGIVIAKLAFAEESCWKGSVVGAVALAELSYSEKFHEGDERPT